MKRFYLRLPLIAVLVLLVAFSSVPAQKIDLTEEDYKQWERLSTTMLSNDGSWFAYGISLVDGDGRLVVKNVNTDIEYVFKVSSRPAFSSDIKWMAFNISFPQKKLEQMRKAKTPIRNKVGLLNLTTGIVDTIENISQFGFSEDGKFLTLKKYKVEGKKSSGSGLVYRNLETGVNHLIGDVAAHIFSEEGATLAVIKDAEEKLGNGVYLYNLADNSYKVLDSDEAAYLSLIWNEDNTGLAFLKSKENKDYEGDYHTVFVVTDLDKTRPAKKEYDPSKDNSFPEGYRIVGSERRLQWSEDGSTLFFGIKEWEMTEAAKKKLEEEKKKEEAEEEEKKDEKKSEEEELPPPGVDVWHWKDVNIQPRQARTAAQDRNFNCFSAWHINANKFVQLADDDVRTVSLTGDQKHSIGYNTKPYEPAFKDSWRDVCLINIYTGERKLIYKKFAGSFRSSPGGKYLIYFLDNNWWTFNIATYKHVNVTKNIDARFENFQDDHPVANTPPWGIGQWFKDDEAVLLYDQYDIWRVTPDGINAERLTDGSADKIRFRQFRLDVEEQFLDPAKPVYIVAYGDFTKDSGYFRLENGNMTRLIYEPRRVGSLAKAKDADKFIFRKEKADESPNVFITNYDFYSPQQITDTNPQQKDFYWAGSELMTYTNKNGVKLQGSLLYPANYEEGKEYPMILYIYERRSQGLHSYIMPSNRSSYNQRVYSSLGFFVFEPDIIYRIGEPGISAVECVVPAVEEVLKRGDINENRVGLMGHSWGGYQTAFLVTQTDIFAAAVAGAPLINMISMYSSVYWNSGQTNQVIFETSQGRLPNPYWDDYEQYVRNSPLFSVKNITTPLLVEFGDNDGAVDWNQGVEMFNAMRRQQKEFVMLVYAGENHSNSKRENQLHYAKSVKEWFLHFLKDEPAPKWITEGVPFLEKPKK